MIERITAQSDRFGQLAKLFDAYRVFYRKEPELKQAQQFLEERIKNNESVIYITLNNQQTICGFVQLYPLFSSRRMMGLWLLNDLFVVENFRGKGYSKQLINAAKQHCIKTNYCGLILETKKNNTVANNLYKKTSFKIDQQHNFYFWEMLQNT